MSEQNVYIYKAYYRATGYGGRDETFLYRVENGDIIQVQPMLSIRSRTGRHGWDEWHLLPGTYIIISISRSNNRNAPYTIDVQKLHVSSDDKADFHRLFTEKVMDLDEIDNLIEKAKKMLS